MIIDYTILIVSWVTLGTFFGYLVYFRVTLYLTNKILQVRPLQETPKREHKRHKRRQMKAEHEGIERQCLSTLFGTQTVSTR